MAWRAPRGMLDGVLRSRLDQVVALARETTSVDDCEIEQWERGFTDALAGRWPVQA